MSEIYGTQLDDALKAFTDLAEGKPLIGCEITDILMEYYDRLKLDHDSNAVQVRQEWRFGHPPGTIVVRIKLDGYQVEFVHHPSFGDPAAPVLAQDRRQA